MAASTATDQQGLRGRSQSSLPRLLHRIEASLFGEGDREFLAGDLTVLKLHAEAATLGAPAERHPVLMTAADEVLAAIRDVRASLGAEGNDGADEVGSSLAAGERLLRAAWLMIGVGAAGLVGGGQGAARFGAHQAHAAEGAYAL